MPRCGECNKFVSYGDVDVSGVEAAEMGSESTLTVSGSVNLTCSECGTEIKTAELSTEIDVAEQFSTLPDFEGVSGVDIEYEVTEANFEERQDGPPKKTSYGFQGTVTIKRIVRVEEEVTVDVSAVELASNFDDYN